MRKLLHRGKKLTTGVTCLLLLLRSQDIFFVLKSNRHQVTHFISKVQSHCNSLLFYFFFLQMNKYCKFNNNSTNTLLPQSQDKEGLLQFCQLQKKSLTLYAAIWYFKRQFRIFVYLFHDFSRNPYTRTVESWLGNTALE